METLLKNVYKDQTGSLFTEKQKEIRQDYGLENFLIVHFNEVDSTKNKEIIMHI